MAKKKFYLQKVLRPMWDLQNSKVVEPHTSSEYILLRFTQAKHSSLRFTNPTSIPTSLMLKLNIGGQIRITDGYQIQIIFTRYTLFCTKPNLIGSRSILWWWVVKKYLRQQLKKRIKPETSWCWILATRGTLLLKKGILREHLALSRKDMLFVIQ